MRASFLSFNHQTSRGSRTCSNWKRQVLSLKKGKQLRILDFDIENRPLSYLGMDFTTADITAIAASWMDERKVHVWLLGEVTTEEMLLGFLNLYNQAGIVTGHYIRGHDLKHINGALMEANLPVLGRKLVSDTKTDLVKRKGISASQESLADILDVGAPKYHMTQKMWRAGNRLEPDGIAETKRRVVSDIKQHKEMRKRLIDNGYLAPPSLWTPTP